MYNGRLMFINTPISSGAPATSDPKKKYPKLYESYHAILMMIEVSGGTVTGLSFEEQVGIIIYIHMCL